MMIIGTQARPTDSANCRWTWKINAGTSDAETNRKNGRTMAMTSGG